jgi:hypothetical protein
MEEEKELLQLENKVKSPGSSAPGTVERRWALPGLSEVLTPYLRPEGLPSAGTKSLVFRPCSKEKLLAQRRHLPQKNQYY